MAVDSLGHTWLVARKSGGSGNDSARHSPTPAERDERVALDLSPDDALRLLLRSHPDKDAAPEDTGNKKAQPGR